MKMLLMSLVAWAELGNLMRTDTAIDIADSINFSSVAHLNVLLIGNQSANQGSILSLLLGKGNRVIQVPGGAMAGQLARDHCFDMVVFCVSEENELNNILEFNKKILPDFQAPKIIVSDLPDEYLSKDTLNDGISAVVRNAGNNEELDLWLYRAAIKQTSMAAASPKEIEPPLLAHDELLRRSGGKMVYMSKMVELLREETQKFINYDGELNSKSLLEIRRDLHSLAGSAGTMGLKRLLLKVQETSSVAKTRTKEETIHKLSELKPIIEQTLKQLDEFLAKNQA